ncbi:mitochondrial amidoxime reducing component 2-like isoform X2 [Portunus trituberculatus]|uniref:mitochondrial amidoxime reducing component 2-like isoform X2 n=1 Tax=Portunus trituberculatus TaxID=210409 RepID=UPI001E1CBD06|nr:mitochondrial amidoxime reducing component 2-like isoform X2 [Portunus trituberculatus]
MLTTTCVGGCLGTAAAIALVTCRRETIHAFPDRVLKITCVGAGLGAAAVFALAFFRRQRRPVLPEKWEEVGEVCSMTIYPLKSGRGVTVTEGEATSWGLASGELQDRCFMVVLASTGTFVTGRQAENLLAVTLTFKNGVITLESKGTSTLKYDLKNSLRHPKVMDSKIWREPVRGVDCGDEPADWLSNVLYNGKEKVRLIYKADAMKRRPPRRLTYYDFPQIRDTDTLYYADTSAFLVTSQSSLEDLNHRLTQPIKMDNFRPNIVLSGGPPFQEDEWLYIRIGRAVFRKIKPCERQVLWKGLKIHKKSLTFTSRRSHFVEVSVDNSGPR